MGGVDIVLSHVLVSFHRFYFIFILLNKYYILHLSLRILKILKSTFKIILLIFASLWINLP